MTSQEFDVAYKRLALGDHSIRLLVPGGWLAGVPTLHQGETDSDEDMVVELSAVASAQHTPGFVGYPGNILVAVSSIIAIQVI